MKSLRFLANKTRNPWRNGVASYRTFPTCSFVWQAGTERVFDLILTCWNKGSKRSLKFPNRGNIITIADKLHKDIFVLGYYYGGQSGPAKLPNQRAPGECVAIANFNIIVCTTAGGLQEEGTECKLHCVCCGGTT